LRRKDRTAPQQTLAASTAERIGAIVEAAEKAAVTVIDDAEAQARRHLEQAEAEADRLVAERLGSLGELTGELTAQAEAIKAESERLLALLDEAKRSLGAAGAPESGPVGEPEPARPTHLTAVTAVGEPEPVPLGNFTTADEENGAPADGEARTPAGARLLATQMAVSGSSRAEIEARLRNGFEIEDTGAILDAILGPEE
jgi:vacuolar-type H+-ATPase subunit H